MTPDLERDSASYDRIRRWLSRTLEDDSVDRLVVRHDTGAEVTTMRGDEGGPFESKDGPVDEIASAISERVLEDAIGLGGVQRYIVTAYGLDKVIARLTLQIGRHAAPPGFCRSERGSRRRMRRCRCLRALRPSR